jgi:TPP-dependent pyruvate/acetoin dehydrogenase alpha subunit
MSDAKTSLSRDEHRDLHYFMVLTRGLEDRMGKLFRQNKIVGGLYRSTGQEGGAVGCAYALRETDWLGPMIRDMGSSLVRGWDPYAVLSQFMARGDSPTMGRDGNLHFGSLAMRQPACISHLGTLVPVMAGVTLAARMRGEDTVAMTMVGDGTTSTGVFHEGMNFIAVQNLPVVIVGQDNKYAYSTPISKQMGCEKLADRALSYGMTTMAADGNDVEEVLVTARAAVEHARRGDGPVFLVLDTMRMCGHAEHDDARYVPPEIFERWRALDPIDRHRGRVLELGVLTRAEIAEVIDETQDAIETAVERALKAPDADATDVHRWVYAEGDDPRGTGQAGLFGAGAVGEAVQA